jgi:VWFA-related protein
MKCAIALAFGASLVAQDPRFDVQSRLVVVPTIVTDAKGRSVHGLEAADFRILDNGWPQKPTVDTFGTGVAPIALVIAVQSSGISGSALVKIRKISAMIQPLITGEHGSAAVVSFAERIEWLQDFTNEPDLFARAFYELRPAEDKSGRMLDAASQAIERLAQKPNVRRVLLLISESRDRGSETDLNTVIVAAQTAGVAVYSVTYSAFKTGLVSKPTDTRTPDPPSRPPLPRREEEKPARKENIPLPPVEQRVDILGGIAELARLGKANSTQILASTTGGETFDFTRQKGLENAIENLGKELHTEYVLSFVPQYPSPGFHRLEVSLTRRGKFRIRARPGYWTLPPVSR